MSCKDKPGSCKAQDYYTPQKSSKSSQMKKQSPVDIVKTTPLNKGSIQLEKFDLKPTKWYFTNNGHTVQLQGGDWTLSSLSRPGITGGPLEKENYIFEQLHFHWPSEHKYEGKSFPLEMHMVFFNKKYGEYRLAVGKDFGITVVGILFEKKDSSDELEWLASNLQNMLEPGTGLEISSDNNKTLGSFSTVVEGLKSNYVYYEGSLTTPPYTENIKWIVSKRTGSVTDQQLAAFKSIKLKEGKKANAREVQPIGDRSIYLVK